MPGVSADGPPMLKADPAYRRRILLLYAGCVLLAVGLLIAAKQWGIPLLVDYLQRSGEVGMRRVRVVAIVWMLIPLVACVAMFRLGYRIRRSQQLPTPGTRVIYDTPVVHGRRARQFGTAVIVVSVVTGLVVVGFTVWFARLLTTLA